MDGFHGVFKVTIDQQKACPHTTLLRRGGVIVREIDDTGYAGIDVECYFYDSWHARHEGIVHRAMELDQELTFRTQCEECVRRYGACDAPDCFFNLNRRRSKLL